MSVPPRTRCSETRARTRWPGRTRAGSLIERMNAWSAPRRTLISTLMPVTFGGVPVYASMVEIAPARSFAAPLSTALSCAPSSACAAETDT